MERLKSVMELLRRTVHDRGGSALHNGKLNCRQSVTLDRDLGWDWERSRQPKRSCFDSGVLVQGEGQTIKGDTLPRERRVQLWVHPATRITNLVNTRQILAQSNHPQRLEPFDDHFIGIHRCLLQLRKSDLDSFELLGLFGELGAGLGLAQAQNAPELLHCDVLVDELRDF